MFINAYRLDSVQKVIFRLYRRLQEIKTTNTIYIKQKWDSESNNCLSEDTWLKYCEFQWKITNSKLWRSFGWKCLIRYVITPAQYNYRAGSSSCRRLCHSQEANHYHLFWAWPKINTFWHKVFLELVTIFAAEISFNWEELLFGLVRSDNLSVEHKYLIGTLTLAARKSITKKCLKPDTPNIDEWYDIVYEVFVMERITYSLRLQPSKFDEIWKQWKWYISVKRPSFVEVSFFSLSFCFSFFSYVYFFFLLISLWSEYKDELDMFII